MGNNEFAAIEPLVIISNAISGGGAEKTMLSLHKEFINEGINCHLIALNRSESIINIPNVKSLNRTWNDGLISTFTAYFQLKNYLKKIGSKTLIINCELPELYVAFFDTKNKKIICVEHTTKPWRKKIILGVVVRTILKIKKVNWVTVINNNSRIWLGQTQPIYIPNPYIEEPSSIVDINNLPCLVFIGGLKANKHPEWVIQAGIQNKLPVHLYGEGVLKTSLKAKYNNDNHNINFHGYKSNVWGLLPKCALVIVASDFEGDGMVVVEAAIQKFPLLLRNNTDLKRFAFESKHYFNSLDELNLIVKENLLNNFINLIVHSEKSGKLAEERSLKTIVTKWKYFLKSLR